MLHVLLGVALCSITALLPAGCSHIIVHVKSVVPTVQVRVGSLLLVRPFNSGFFFFFFLGGPAPSLCFKRTANKSGLRWESWPSIGDV